jgi:hypothetical protein
MNTQLLIDAIVRQTTVLIAQLATAGGIRAPLSHVANQVFVDLANQLRTQGVSRKVSADMFGMALRAYVRKLQRLSESSTERGESLWQAILDFITSRPVAGRAEILRHFHRDDPITVRGILHDLTETGLVFCSGTGDATVFRAVGEDEARFAAERSDEATDELLAVLIFRDGPLSNKALLERTGMAQPELQACIDRLCACEKVVVDAAGNYRGKRFHIPLSDDHGWEAAVFDHYHALVRTLCARLQQGEADQDQRSGGATYTFEVWQGHPLEAEVMGFLAQVRQRLSDLRQRVDGYNEQASIPAQYAQVVCYAGQHVLDRSDQL